MQTLLIILLSLVSILLLAMLILIQPYTVPENWEFQISIFKRYWKTSKAGLHLRFRWITAVDHEVFMGEQAMCLALGDNSALGGGVVDFQDVSAPVTAFMFFKVFNSYKAAYETANVMRMVEEQGDGTLRSFLAQYNVEEANELKNNFNLEIIASMTKPVAGVPTPPLNTSHIYAMLQNWGVELLAFTVTDIALPAAVIEQRQRKQKAATDVEVADLEIKTEKRQAKKTLIKAEATRAAQVLISTGEAQGMDKISEAMAKRISELVAKNGMTAEAATAYVIQITKAEALKNAKQVIWNEGQSMAANGAAFGAGFNTNNNTPNP